MHSTALAGEIYLYTNRRGLYQSLLDLSVFSYVSYWSELECSSRGRIRNPYRLPSVCCVCLARHCVVFRFWYSMSLDCCTCILCLIRIWMSWWRCAPALSGQREEMELVSYTCCWRAQDLSRKTTIIEYCSAEVITILFSLSLSLSLSL